jgi:hypothetical protein
MFLLDENIAASQRELLRRWKNIRQIGVEVTRKGLDDQDQIIPLLLRIGRVTFLTRDQGFYPRRLCHASYCIVVLDVRPDDAARVIRAVLRLPEFKTVARRAGIVARASLRTVTYWRFAQPSAHTIRTFK